MLMLMDKMVDFCGLVRLDNWTHTGYFKTLNMVLTFYRKADLKFRSIFCDGDFIAIMDESTNNHSSHPREEIIS